MHKRVRDGAAGDPVVIGEKTRVSRANGIIRRALDLMNGRLKNELLLNSRENVSLHTSRGVLRKYGIFNSGEATFGSHTQTS
jgi:hypothetical protein